MSTLYINKPGGVILHMKDGSSESFAYGKAVDTDKVADHVTLSNFADSTKRIADEEDLRVLESHRRTALSENGQVNSSSSPVPANYNDLDEDGAVQLVRNLATVPEQQAALIKHEILFGGGRQKVLDAAGEYARVASRLQIDALPSAVRDGAGDAPTGQPVEPFIDPARGGATSDPEVAAARVQADADRLVLGLQGNEVPPPTTSGDAGSGDSTTTTDGRNGGTDKDGGEATAWNADSVTHADIDAYVAQHDLEGVPAESDATKQERIDAISAVEGHEVPATPVSTT